MASERGPTTIAIIFGVCIGAVAALLARSPEPRGAPAAESAPSAPEAPVPEPSVAPPAPRPEPPPAVATAVPAADAAAPASPATPSPKLDDVPLAESELGCARRVPRACLSASHAHAEGLGTRVDAAKARLYRMLAVSLYDEQCTARDPEACQELGAIYASGLVVPPYPEAPKALAERARELCQGKTSAFCAGLAAK